LSSTGVELDPRGVKARFADTDTQIKAKDVLQSGLGSGYTVALNLLLGISRLADLARAPCR
jgi:preprotein translocase subunit SecD